MVRKLIMAGAISTLSLLGALPTQASADTTIVGGVCSVGPDMTGAFVFVPVGVPVVSNTTVADQCSVGVYPVK